MTDFVFISTDPRVCAEQHVYAYEEFRDRAFQRGYDARRAGRQEPAGRDERQGWQDADLEMRRVCVMPINHWQSYRHPY